MIQTLKVGTGLAKGKQATPELATQAVVKAMEKAGLSHPCSVLLYLTTEFATNPHAAIMAAARAASTTQVMGCSASGILTEDEWVLDGAAAAAMVFSHDVLSSQANDIEASEHLLTLAAPSALNSTWLLDPKARFGGVSGDATGHGPFSVWHHGKGASAGYCEFGIKHGTLRLGISHGLKALSSSRRVTASEGYTLHRIASMPALDSLSASCKRWVTGEDGLPYHMLMVAYARHAQGFETGDYQLASLVMADEHAHTVTLSRPIAKGDWIRWMLRDADSAATEIAEVASQLNQAFTPPAFGLLFSCLGRGPYFYQGDDLDLTAIRAEFPQLPLIGFYGNGEIAPILGDNTLLPYSAVFGLYHPNPTAS
jgi:small ligand-binding sensory domain FIST